MAADTCPTPRRARWGLLPRIAAAQSLLLLCGALLTTVLLTQQHRGEVIRQQEARARLLLLVVSPLVAEQAVVGDYATIKQLLERQATVYSDTASLAWLRDGREGVAVRLNPPVTQAPDWFVRLVDLPETRREAPVALGGIDYGSLRIRLDPTESLNGLWGDFIYYLSLSFGMSLLLLFVLLIVLRSNLRVLRDLAGAAERFSRGELDVRIEAEGAREVHDAAVAFNDMTGRIRQLLGELSDSRQQYREQLHFTEELIEALPVPMYYKDTEGIYTTVNKAWEDFFGLPRAEALGRRVRDLYPHNPETATFHERMDEELWRSGGVQVYEIPIRTMDGRERQAMYSKTTLTDAEGRVAGMIGIITDVTELKTALQQAQAAQVAKAAAEQASQAKSRFLANMSHEIRTPLTAIIGFSEALLDVNQSMRERIEGIQTIHRAGKHLLNVINDILDLSKIEAGRLEVERLPVPVLELIEEVAALGRMQAEAKGIAFRVEPLWPLPQTVTSDPVRLKQILLNLIGNAIKFTERGGVTLRVRHDAKAARLVMEVIDTGIGIRPDQLARLFQPFSQADASTTRRFGGTGLGLVLSKQLAEMLGGGIAVDSTPGQGSRFTLSVATGSVGSLLESAEDVRRVQETAEETEELPPLSGRILVAEDNPDNQRLIHLNARRLGAEVNIVENGERAVAEALAEPYDLILMDMQMPVMDGLTATRTLRAQGYRGPIVALTANATHQDMQNCLEAGCDGFLSKPIERNRFGETLQRYLPVRPVEEMQEEPIIPVLLQRDPGLGELMGHFLSRVTDQHRELERALAEGDHERIRQQARKMKTVGADYMCPQVSEIAGQLEFAATAGNARAVRELVARLAGVIARIRLPAPVGTAAADDAAPLVSELLQEGPEMADLVEYFLGRLPGYEQALKDALAAGDLAALKKQAHDLKSVGGGYGYPPVTELAVRLEASAAEGRQDELAVLVEDFSRLARRIQAGAHLQPAPHTEGALA